MSKGLNRVTLFGHLGNEPELRTLASGRSLLRMRLATSESYVTKEGNREERTDWHNVVMWGARAEGLSRVLRKGSLILVEGQIRTTTFEKDGERRYYTDIQADNIVLGGRNSSRSAPAFPFEPNEHDDPHLPEDPGERRAPEPPPEERRHPAEERTPSQLELPAAAPARKKTRSPASSPAMAAA